jgi:hypothetical protein
MTNERKPHRLFNMLMDSNPAEEDVEELFADLQYVFSNPFDPAIEEAVTNRQAMYIDNPDQLMN